MDFSNPKFKKLFFEVYEHLPRGGPGDAESTQRAYKMMKGLPAQPRILDVGCGPGAQTLDLARMTTGSIVAVDNHPPFLKRLSENVARAGLGTRIQVKEADMFQLPFAPESFDVLWSEGAIYNLGFENGLRTLGVFVKPGGCMAVSEAVWTRPDPPGEVKANWDEEYPAITTIADNVAMVGRCGFKLLGHFTLPKSSWIDDFYAPMAKRIDQVAARHAHDPEAMEIIAILRHEIEIYEKYWQYFSYEFLVMRK